MDAELWFLLGGIVIGGFAMFMIMLDVIRAWRKAHYALKSKIEELKDTLEDKQDALDEIQDILSALDEYEEGGEAP